MDINDATEEAYKNGYEDGKRDAEEEIRILKQKRANIFEILKAYERGMDSAVKHGRWLEGNGRQPCSVCRYRGMRSWKFCPNCGARMDGNTDG